jgi:cysteine desulfurase
LDLDGFAVSAGSACSSGKVKASGVLTAMGASDDDARGAIRISLGVDNTDAECDALVAAWTKLATRNRARSAA